MKTPRKPGAKRAGNRIFALGVALLAVIVSSCATMQRDIRYDERSGGGQTELSQDELMAIELELVLARAEPDSAKTRVTRTRLEELAAVPSSNSARQARVLALLAEAALQGGDTANARRYVDKALAAYPGDEIAAVVASRLTTSPEERLAALERAVRVADATHRIRLELGAALLAVGRNREAVAAFDAALPYLDEAYTALYGAERDRAWALKDADAAPAGASSAYLTGATITLVGMAELAQAETDALDRLTGGVDWASGVLFERLKAAGWYVDPAASPRSGATRCDAARFLWSMMTHGAAATARRYTERYSYRGTSPVPDVPYGSPCFDAVLGVVEEGIMPLVDGRSFAPELAVSGLDYYGWLMLAADWR